VKTQKEEQLKRFSGKVALVTGAGRGIGRGIAWQLAQEGAHLVINDLRDGADAQTTAAQVRKHGQQALVLPADVSDRGAMEKLFAAAVAHFGRIDIAIANAGMSIRKPMLEMSWDEARRTIEVCELGVLHTCQLAAQQMVQQEKRNGNGGKIVIIGSVHADSSWPTCAPYDMAKAAINHFARTLSVELAPYRINVNVVNPGWIDTPGERNFSSEAELRKGAQCIPWKRLGQPTDIAKAVAFLASDDADYVTGAALRVDGGFVPGLTLPPAE
jgi:glucose 1-dehydrogenase